eukprot:TRINITY_DN40997_c0_g1_i1.p1 TRINITY_DN40997_c0_g1~~TRINITY_DN40997_c0_g1_i1.p1  ORF type:complete len:153 (-),score=34.20 TRINITY_DN40997_c0_g1_i1:75-533(-)
MTSGVKADQSGLEEYQKFKLASEKSNPNRYIQYSLSSDKAHMVVEKCGARTGNCEADFNTMREDVTKNCANDCRFILFDFEAQISASEGTRKKIVFIFWASDDAPTKSKMTYAASKNDFKTALGDSGMPDFQATDASELTWNAIFEKVFKKV